MKTLDLHIHSTYSDGTFSVEEIIKSAKSIGLTTISITDHDTIANKKGSVGKPQIARAVFENPENQSLLESENLTNYASFFAAYLSDTGKVFVEREEKIDFIDGIKLIHAAGGKAVWAHSYYNLRKFENQDSLFDELLQDFINAGLDGIETFYSTFSEEKTKRLYKIAKDKNLIMTAGSDFHSPDKEEAPELACWKDYGLELNLDERLIQTLN